MIPATILFHHLSYTVTTKFYVHFQTETLNAKQMFLSFSHLENFGTSKPYIENYLKQWQ